LGTRNLKLQVVNADGEERGILKLEEGATLNLTCRVVKPGDGKDEVKLSWYLPNNRVRPGTERYQLPRENPSSSSSNLVIDPVVETDTGDYECWAKQDWGEGTVKTKLKVLIEPKRGACQPGYFECEGQKKICIATRYRCDRRQDCPNGDDESDKYCGYDPCKGKIICPELDNRCIEPQEYCCDPATDPNCEFTYSCCEALLEFSLGTRLTAQYAKQQREGGGEGRGDLGYLRGTVYTVIGCAVAFLVIVIALGVAICRLHIQRKTRSAALVRGAGRSHPPITLHDLDIYFSERGEEDRADFQHIGITYNINHGVQILGPGGRNENSQPPPYSTQPRRVRDDVRRGPPPPYRSNEHLPEAPLLGEEDGNNNGDINGNSDMTDNNAVLAVNEPTLEVERRRGEDLAEDRRIENLEDRREDLERRREGLDGRRRILTNPREAEPPPRYPGLESRRERARASSSDSDTE